VINEFAYDDTGADDKEFVELWNRTNAPVDISGWVLQVEEGTATSGANASFTFPASTFINPGQYLVIATATVPNVNFVRPVDWLENSIGPDGITLRDTGNNVIDGVVWCYALWTNPAPTWLEGTGLWGRVFLADAGANNPTFTSAQRRVDGYDSNNNGNDFVYMPWTPGTANGSANTELVPNVQMFDGAPATILGTAFAGSFRAPTIQNPAALVNATASTITIPASPQGGNVAVFCDPTGGGNSNYLVTPVGDDYLVECYVYIKGGNAVFGTTQGEAWGIGVGTTDSYASPVDVPGTYYAATSLCPGSTGTAPLLTATGSQQPGATGIAWFGYTTATQTAIYLVDMNDGGPGFTVLGGPIVATTGSNDGWQRLRLRVQGTAFTANFGGTFAVNNGTVFTGTVAARPSGQVYFQYRECITTNANMTPLIIDNLQVYGTLNASAVVSGVGSPSSGGVATMAVNTPPVVGDPTFAISSTTFPYFGVGALVVSYNPLIPGGVQIPGAQPGALAYIPTLDEIFIAFADGLGNVVQPIPIPANNALVGVIAGAQWVVLDATLPYPLQFATSPAVALQVGN
jgi:hypothetical protein